jgi:hypothetical protein
MYKRGEELIVQNIIFVLLNLVLFLTLFIFILNSADEKYVAEQVYSKNIAMIIDMAKPEQKIFIDMSELFWLVEKEIDRGSIKREDIIKIDSSQKYVFVALGHQTSYAYRYFSDYSINYEVNGNYLIVDIGEKNE